MAQQIIEQFFVPIKKIQKGEPIPLKNEAPLKKKATEPEKLGHPKLQEWLNRNRKTKY